MKKCILSITILIVLCFCTPAGQQSPQKQKEPEKQEVCKGVVVRLPDGTTIYIRK